MGVKWHSQRVESRHTGECLFRALIYGRLMTKKVAVGNWEVVVKAVIDEGEGN